MNYLDKNGLIYLWSLIKAKFAAVGHGHDSATTSADGFMSSEDKTKLNGIATGATANTGTVTSVNTGVGLTGGEITNSGTVKANLKTEKAHTLSSAEQTNTTSRQYAVGVDKDGFLSVNVPWTAYTHPTSAGNKHIPTGGSAGQVLKYGGSSGTATWADEYSYTHPASGATAGSYGPTANVTGSNNTTLTVPQITVDSEGHITNVVERTYTSKDTTYGAGTADMLNTGSDTANRVWPAKQIADFVNGKISSVFKPQGSLAFANLPIPAATNLGYVWNVTDAFTTTASFVEGAGATYPAGTNVVVVQNGSSYKFDCLSGSVDLSGYAQLSDLVAITNAEIDAIAV